MVVEIEAGHDVLRLRVHKYYRNGLWVVKKKVEWVIHSQ